MGNLAVLGEKRRQGAFIEDAFANQDFAQKLTRFRLYLESAVQGFTADLARLKQDLRQTPPGR